MTEMKITMDPIPVGRMYDRTAKTSQRCFDEAWEFGYDFKGHEVAVTNNAHGVYTHRYSIDGGKYTLHTYADAMATTGKGVVGEESDWLKCILDVAYLGGQGLKLVTTPPDYVLWFETDAEMHLLRFVVAAEQLNDGV